MNANDIKPIAFVNEYMSGHSCSYYCDRPECIKTQRDELRDSINKIVNAAVETEREACAKEASDLAEIGYDGFAVAIALRATARAKGKVK